MLSAPIRSCWMNDDWSSTAQNQKFRLKTSAGCRLSPSAFHAPYMSWKLSMWSRRSRRPATQPIPPSDRQILKDGYLVHTPEYSQSTAAVMAYAKNSTPATSGGASSVVDGDVPDDPMCRFTTVPVSAQAAISGSQWPE